MKDERIKALGPSPFARNMRSRVARELTMSHAITRALVQMSVIFSRGKRIPPGGCVLPAVHHASQVRSFGSRCWTCSLVCRVDSAHFNLKGINARLRQAQNPLVPFQSSQGYVSRSQHPKKLKAALQLNTKVNPVNPQSNGVEDCFTDSYVLFSF